MVPVLSRGTLHLDPTARRRGASAEYSIHQLVADWFGDRNDRGYLFRVTDGDHRAGRYGVLALSAEAPLGRLPERAFGMTEAVESRPYDVKLAMGQTLDYEIRINATRVVTDSRGMKTRRDVWDAAFEEDPGRSESPNDVYRGYLGRKLHESARIQECRITERSLLRIRRPGGGRPIQIVAANLIGLLRVDDPDSFLTGVFQGFGRAKAFGCGLMCMSIPGSVLARRYGPVP